MKIIRYGGPEDSIARARIVVGEAIARTTHLPASEDVSQAT
ncbi:MAG: hypothetical protein AAF517_04025 [Planctomycetota bacterium]